MLSIFGFMHEFWRILTIDMTCTLDRKTIRFEVVLLLLLLSSFDVFVPTSAHPLLFLDKWFVQIYFEMSVLEVICT
jgi:hypothetical protein